MLRNSNSCAQESRAFFCLNAKEAKNQARCRLRLGGAGKTYKRLRNASEKLRFALAILRWTVLGWVSLYVRTTRRAPGLRQWAGTAKELHCSVNTLSGEKPDRHLGLPANWSEPGGHVRVTNNFPLGRANAAPCGPTEGSPLARLLGCTTWPQANISGPSFLHTFGQCKKYVPGSCTRNMWFASARGNGL